MKTDNSIPQEPAQYKASITREQFMFYKYRWIAYEEAGMIIAAITFRLHAPWVHSLKEKRMVVKSLVTQLQNRFHVSAAEIDELDTHRIIVICAAAIVPHNAIADSLMDEISTFVEENTEAELLNEIREIR